MRLTSHSRHLLITAIAAIGLVAAVAVSADSTIALPVAIANVNPAKLIGRIIKTVLGLAGVAALVVFIYGGFTWMTAAGNAKKIDEAKNTLIWAAIGLVVMFASYTIASLVIKSITGQTMDSKQKPSATQSTTSPASAPGETMDFTEEENEAYNNDMDDLFNNYK